MNTVNAVIVRAGMWMVLLLCIFAVTILLDIWRIERHAGKPLPAMAMLVLSITLAAASVIFLKVAWTGVLPQTHQECP